jgi:hypothetical protein
MWSRDTADKSIEQRMCMPCRLVGDSCTQQYISQCVGEQFGGIISNLFIVLLTAFTFRLRPLRRFVMAVRKPASMMLLSPSLLAGGRQFL